jgi:predicted phosphodiesterase
MSKVELIALGDTHMPFQNRRAIDWAIQQIRELKPAYVVQMGDLLDQYGFSKHTTNPNLMSPQEELLKGLKYARQMWSDIRDASPKSKCIQISGNHDARLRKRVAEKMPELQGIIDLDLFEFPGVRCENNDREYIRLVLPESKTPVILTHGWYTRTGAHMAYFNESVIFGHLHRPSILYEPRGKGKPLFELNCGYLGNQLSPVFNYGNTVRRKWQNGIGLVIDGNPSFMAFTK